MAVLNQFSVTCPNDHKNIVDETLTRCPDCNHRLNFDWTINWIERKTNVDKMAVFNRLIEYCDKHNLYVDVYNGIAGPGYPDQTMIAADWNPDNMKRIGDFIENYFDDISLEWSDEWTSCCECYKAIRTSPDCYSWQAYYILGDGYITCLDCVKENFDDYIEDYINDSNKAIPSELIQTALDNGFKEVEDMELFESGFHDGQNDTPEKALDQVCKRVGTEWFYANQDYIFYIAETSQFYITFSLLTRKKED